MITRRSAHRDDDEPAAETPADPPARSVDDITASMLMEIRALSGQSPSGVESAAARLAKLVAELRGLPT